MRVRPRLVPAHATAREVGAARTEYWVRGQVRWVVLWHDSGQPAWLWCLDAEGRRHGVEREFCEDGNLRFETHHRSGLRHGLQRQWDQAGRLLCATRFVHGSGLELGCVRRGARVVVAESRQFMAGDFHGPERWWAGSTSVYGERCWFHGVEHGISRWWDGAGLRQGFPKFFIRGREVGRARYERAAANDSTLPPLRLKDDAPRRPSLRSTLQKRPDDALELVGRALPAVVWAPQG